MITQVQGNKPTSNALKKKSSKNRKWGFKAFKIGSNCDDFIII